MVERAVVVEQPEQQRPDVRARPVLVPAEPGDHAIGRALVLDLEHRPLARLVRRIEALGDDAVEAGALEPVEPVGGRRPVARRGRQVDRRGRLAQDRLEAGAALGLRHVAEVLVAERQQVPGDERRGRFGGQHVDPRRRRVDAQQQRLEVERAVAGDDDLAVEHAALGQRGAQRVGQLREVAVERLEVARLRVDRRRRRGRRSPGSRPTSARTASRRRSAGRPRPWPASARAAVRRGVPRDNDTAAGPRRRAVGDALGQAAGRRGTMRAMTDQAERYDRIAAGYARWWAPVLAPAVDELLDGARVRRSDDGARLVDIGTGTGQLALGALRRWPAATIVGVDASAGMRAVADAEADRRLAGVGSRPVQLARGVRRRAAVRRRDVRRRASRRSCSSSSRAGRARCARRAACCGRTGVLAYVTWLAGRPACSCPDRDLRRRPRRGRHRAREGDGRSGDMPSVELAAGELRHAGFAGRHRARRRARAPLHGRRLRRVPRREFDEETLFDELEPDAPGAADRRRSGAGSAPAHAGADDDALPDRLRDAAADRADRRPEAQPSSDAPPSDALSPASPAAAPSRLGTLGAFLALGDLGDDRGLLDARRLDLGDDLVAVGHQRHVARDRPGRERGSWCRSRRSDSIEYSIDCGR